MLKLIFPAVLSLALLAACGDGGSGDATAEGNAETAQADKCGNCDNEKCEGDCKKACDENCEKPCCKSEEHVCGDECKDGCTHAEAHVCGDECKDGCKAHAEDHAGAEEHASH